MKKQLCILCMLFGFQAMAANGPEAGRVLRNNTVAQEEMSFEAWCDRKLRNLERAQREASTYSLRGNYAKSLLTLVNALKSEVYQYGDLNPLTLNLIQYGARLGDRLIATVSQDERGVKASVIGIENFYDLIFKTASKIDYQYYYCQSYLRGCHYRRSAQFESNVFEMAKDLITLLNDTFAIKRGGVVYPVGPSTAYLNASEIILGAANRELKSLVYAESYACEILDLDMLVRGLASFNRESNSEYEKRDQLNQTYYEVESLIYRLRDTRACGNYR